MMRLSRDKGYPPIGGICWIFEGLGYEIPPQLKRTLTTPQEPPPLAMRRTLISVIAMSFAGAALLAFWVKREHRPAEAIAAVHAYIEGVDADAGWKDRLRRCATPTAFTPFQTNGNRLRRLAGNLDPDPAEVSVDFFDCSVRFHLRKQGSGSWRVYKVQSHAG